MNKQSLTAVIIALNEAEMIGSCIDTLHWCSEIIVLDNGSTDDTVAIAKKKGAQIATTSKNSFAEIRNHALQYVKTEWVIYVDADERITPELAQEIISGIETNKADVFSFNRLNILLGTAMKHGGWEKDEVTRVFKKSMIGDWFGEVHESPRVLGKSVKLVNVLYHLTHRSIAANLQKTIVWTPIEAKLLVKALNYRVTPFTVLRKSILEFVRRGIIKSGYRDGEAGLVEALMQAVNVALIYLQIWEFQNKDVINNTYNKIDRQILESWKEVNDTI